MHVYLHVPFCARRCSYCDFAIAVRAVTPEREYVEAVLTEWRARRQHPAVRRDPDLTTVYFGGGTPSRLGGAAIGALLDGLADGARLSPDAEITLEANPDDVTPEQAESWARAGINRVSLGVQSHDPAVLEWMHRTHRPEQVAPAVRALQDAGITDLSLDLIFALPTALRRDWFRDLDLTLELDPTHVSLYGLTVEPKTPLARWTARGEVTTVPDERYAEEYLTAHDTLVNNGFDHYEVSNAARPGHRARHNSAYWRGANYVGLGPSAHSFLDGVRSWNVREWADYAARALSGESMRGGEERLDADQWRLEELYLGLRTDAGLAPWRVPEAARASWLREGWAVAAPEHLRLTAEGWLRLDALVSAVADS